MYISAVIISLMILLVHIKQTLKHSQQTTILSITNSTFQIESHCPADEVNTLVEQSIQEAHLKRLQHSHKIAFFLPIFTGMFASVTLLIVKIFLELCKSAFKSHYNAFGHLETYVILFVMIVMGISQVM